MREILTFGEILYRAYDAVLKLRKEGLNVGLINKPTLNIVDEEVRYGLRLYKCVLTGYLLGLDDP